MVVAGGDDDQAVDPSRGKGRDQLLLTGLVLVGTSRQHQDAAFEGNIFDLPVQRGGEGVGDVFEQDPDR